MSLTISPQIRIFAAVGAVAMLVLVLGMVVLGSRQPASQAAPHVIKPLHPVAKHGLGALPRVTRAKTVRAMHPAKPTGAATKPVASVARVASAPKPKAKPVVSAPAVSANGLPGIVNSALARNRIVVVTLLDPEAKTDGLSLAEAAAGAKSAGAGFVPLNVLNAGVAIPIAKLLGTLPDPAVLIFRAPGTLVLRIDGFADRDTIAQAVANAAFAQ